MDASLFLCLVAAATALLHHAGAGAARPARNFIDDQIIEALENWRQHLASGWPQLGIPPLDPLHLQHLSLNITTDDTSVVGNMTDVAISGLSTFTIDLVHTNLLFLTVDVVLGLPALRATGTYDILGNIGVFPIYGAGPFWMEAVNLSLGLRMDLGQTPDGLFGVSTLNINIDCNTTEIQLENIMGGGDMADFVNGVLSSLGPDMLQALEDQYVPLLEEALLHEINNIIQGGRRDSRDDTVNLYFDLVFANLRQDIIKNGHDPLGLPEDTDNFTISLFNSSLEGELWVGEGRLGGLSSLHRAGDMTLLYTGQQDEVIWGGEVGLIDLQTDYTARLKLALFGQELSFSLKMAFLHLSFETDVFLHPSQLVFARCNISEMGPVHFKEKGAGPLDTPLYNLLANSLLGELTALVSSKVEGVICTLLESAIASSG